MIARLDVLERCLGTTVRAAQQFGGLSEAAQRSKRRAEQLRKALEAMKPVEDGDEEPDVLPGRPDLVEAGQGQAARVAAVPVERKQTGEAVLGVLRAAGGQLPIAEVIQRLPDYKAKNVHTAINGLKSRGKVQTLPLPGSLKNKSVKLTPQGWAGAR